MTSEWTGPLDPPVADEPQAPAPLVTLPLSTALVALGVMVAIGALLVIVHVQAWLAVIPGIAAAVLLTRQIPRCPVPPVAIQSDEDRLREQQYIAWFDRHGRHFVIGHREEFAAAARRHAAREGAQGRDGTGMVRAAGTLPESNEMASGSHKQDRLDTPNDP